MSDVMNLIDQTTPLKFLTGRNHGPFSDFDYTPYLPKKKGTPGKWFTVKGDLRKCNVGIHYATIATAVDWLNENLLVIETAGTDTGNSDKRWCRKARFIQRISTWNDRTARLFACDCAERVLHLANDERAVSVVAVARRYANGAATLTKLAAAEAAAWAAAEAAAEAAAKAAAEAAAWAAAEAAAWYAAQTAAWYAAQTAAWAAAQTAAWHVAQTAAWATAQTAAWHATWDATWTTERQWQRERLLAYLNNAVE